MEKGYTPETREKYRIKLIDFLKKNPKATHSQIRKETKIKPNRVFEGGLKEAYQESNIPLPKPLLRRTKEEQIRDVLEFIKSNPTCTVLDILKVTRVSVPRMFKTMKKAYRMAEEKYPKREGSSVVNSKIKKRAYQFENYVLDLLSFFGEVNKQYKNPSGFADGLITINNQLFVIEIKDYRARNNISLHEVKQVNRYIEAIDNCNRGVLITHANSKGKKDKFYIGGNKIDIISLEEILPWGSVI
jgi:hypothetical protein